jgi:hypothetical protein
MLFPYYQPPVPVIVIDEPPKRKKSCSFCGNHGHFIRECGVIGVTLHGFINTEDKERAMSSIQGHTNAGLEGLLIRLGCCKDSNVRLSRRETLKLIETIWLKIRSDLREMILTDEYSRTSKVIRIVNNK